MSDLSLRDDLVQHLRDIAQRENRQIDEVVETLLNHYDPLADNDTRQARELRQDRLRTYDRARRAWRQMNDPRQQLSNEELDQQFWLIDPHGIPRLKAEQLEVESSADALEQLLNLAEADLTIPWQRQADTAEGTKQILNTEYADHLLARLNRPAIRDEQ